MTVQDQAAPFKTRYSFGGEEFILAEFAEEMGLETNLRVQEITKAVANAGVEGVIDVCPANVSYLVRFDPDVIDGGDLIEVLKRLEQQDLAHQLAPFATRIMDVPILFNDPWTHEVVLKFRDRVQDPTLSDIEYLTKANGLPDTDTFIAQLTSTPSMSTMTGFVPGIVWTYQLVPRERQLQGPKYLWPRTETPDRAFALGGAYPAIYPSPSAGGYPIFGRAAPPVYDPELRLPDFRESAALVRIGDILNYRAIDRAEYDEIRSEVAAGTYRYLIRPVDFEPAAFFSEPEQFCKDLVEALYQ